MAALATSAAAAARAAPGRAARPPTAAAPSLQSAAASPGLAPRAPSLRWALARRPGAARAADTDTAVQEPATNIAFPSSLAIPGDNVLELLGTGVREKKIAVLAVKVYAVGFYANKTFAGFEATWKGRSAAALEEDEGFYSALIRAPVEKTLVLVLARNVGGDQFVEALNEELRPRLKAANEGDTAESALIAFGETIKGQSLKKNSAIIVSWLMPATLQIAYLADATDLKIPEKPLACISSQPLAQALFDVYLGKEAVSPSLKTSIAQGASKIL
eukprot:SM000119S25629  [mRNA]  locus=s119:18711:20446:- [translate_table: standard]